MTDNSSYGRLQSWAVTVSYTSLQLQSKISVEGRERPYHHECCGRRPEISVVRKETEKPNTPPKPHPAAFRPCCVCSSELCVLGYFAASRVLVKEHCSLLSI